jgi:hypothetical protein
MMKCLDLKKRTAHLDREPAVIEEPSEQLEWMECAQQMPKMTAAQNKLHSLIDKNFDWVALRHKYSLQELDSMPSFIARHKQLECVAEIEALPDVEPEQLNQYQRFAYNIIKEYQVINF